MSFTRKHVDEEGRPASLQLDIHMLCWTHFKALNDVYLAFIHVDFMIELPYYSMSPRTRLPHGSRAVRRYILVLLAIKSVVEKKKSKSVVRWYCKLWLS